MSEILKFTVPEYYDGKRAGVYLRTACRFSARSLSVLKGTKGAIERNGSLLRTIDTLNKGDIITIKFPKEESSITPTYGELNILYEDSFILILNKPPFVPVHPVKKFQENTLANFVSFRYNKTGFDFVFRAVNRLDKNTSGIVIVARDRHTASILQKTKIEKYYLAVCCGRLVDSGTVKLPIGLKDGSKIVREVRPDGKNAVTHYTPLKCFNDRTFLELSLETGRTHQIRCHISHLGYPLFGDDLYGGETSEISRQALHCSRVTFKHPYSDETISIVAPLPEDIDNLIKEM